MSKSSMVLEIHGGFMATLHNDQGGIVDSLRERQEQSSVAGLKIDAAKIVAHLGEIDTAVVSIEIRGNRLEISHAGIPIVTAANGNRSGYITAILRRDSKSPCGWRLVF